MKVLVYGGTGSQGSAVVQALLSNGHEPYILTRHPEKAAAMVEQGAKTVTGDLADKDSLFDASAGMDGISLMIPFSLSDPSKAYDYAQDAIDAAKAADVDIIVYNTSGPVIEDETGNPVFDLRWQVIRYLKASELPFITIEPTAYLENLLGPWTRDEIIEDDTLAYPVQADTPIGWVATRDVGALIAAALEKPHLATQRFPASGLKALTGAELAAKFSDGLGREITYREMPLEEFGAKMDEVFGKGAGAGAIEGYRWQQDNRDLLTMWWDMSAVLDKLSVEMTSVAQWANQHKVAFSKETESA